MLFRRQHRRIAMQLLTPKAMQSYAHVLDYEARIMIRSFFNETKQGTLPINPGHYAGRYAFKYGLSLLCFACEVLNRVNQQYAHALVRHENGYCNRPLG